MLTNASQHNLTRLKYLKQHIKPHPNPPWGKPCFRVKSLMAAISYLYIFILNHYHFRTKHRRTTYNRFFLHYFSRDYICLHFKFLRSQIEAIFKVNVKLVLKM